MKKLLVLLVTLFIVLVNSQGQDINRNAFHFEVGGQCGLYSFNYERTYSKNLIGKIGVSLFRNEFVMVPIMFGKYFGSGTHHFEISAGAIYVNREAIIDYDMQQTARRNMVWASAFVGYRLQNPANKFVFRLGFTPGYSLYIEDPYSGDLSGFEPWAGMSFGYRFK